MRIEGDPSMFAAYGGVDIVVYRVPHPLAFLAQQRDLHRVRVGGRYVGEGVGNTLGFLWNRWFARSRMLWQQLFTTRTRRAVVAAAPQLRQAPPRSYHPHYDHPPQYAPLKRFPLIERFRYPVQQAKPIAPPSDTLMQGSSSNFLAPPPGNVHVPLGKLKPGLYLVEAYVGAHRAITTLFVSDTVGISKVAHGHMLVWTADKTSGEAVPGVDLLWSDGTGILDRGHSNREGLLRMTHTVPQTSYVLGKDPAGGVFISENFYYDSEVYGKRFYIFSDRPLYQPGSTVHVKVFARDYLGARRSRPLPAGKARLTLIDAAGRELLSRALTLDPASGADIDLPLPDHALPGGYELRLRYHQHHYTGMFRVARYSKPQFRVDIDFDRPAYHPGDVIRGHIRLHYPDGRPVRHAEVLLDVRAQALSMTDNDAHTRFVHRLAEQKLRADGHGIATFTLPAAPVPSRYTLHAVAREFGAFPVSARKQLQLQPGPLPDTLRADEAPKTEGPLQFLLTRSRKAPAPASWTAIRLQDRSEQHGALDADASGFGIDFSRPGGYSVFVRAADGRELARTQVQIPGDGSGGAMVGLRLHADRARYRIGQVAHITLDFPHPVHDALLTLERDGIAHEALASHGGRWFHLHRLSTTRWRVDVPMRDAYAPNMTFSALYVHDGDFEFENLGLRVRLPAIHVHIHTDHRHYRPGDRVSVDLTTTRDGKPVPAVLSAAVVDNMVYVLQPELAPSIYDFFFHPLRDSVRTTASLAFYGYDMAWSPKAAELGPGDIYHRNSKSPTVQTRPRRDRLDTAAWRPTLRSDAHGHAHFSFVMPDGLSRWRITVRALAGDGSAGQAIGYVRSAKPLYLKWTGPKHFRAGDRPTIGVLAYNDGDAIRPATLTVRVGDAAPRSMTLRLQPGSNAVPLPLSLNNDVTVHLSLHSNGSAVDALDVPLQISRGGWPSWHARTLASNAALKLPPDASDIELEPAATLQQQYAGALDALIDYPYGCVEQTASRLIPLSIALQALPHDEASRALRLRLEQRTQSERERLMRMAGPGARFTWWGGDGDGYPLLTIYAYYADWRASRALGIDLPASHWRRVFDAYQRGSGMPLLHKALSVHLIQAMGLPVKTLLQGLDDELRRAPAIDAKAELGRHASVLLGTPDSAAGNDLALLLYGDAARRAGTPVDSVLEARTSAAAKALAASESPLLEALPELLSAHVDRDRITPILGRLNRRWPTMERALMLAWLDADLDGTAPASAAAMLHPGRDWQRIADGSSPHWRYSGHGIPKSLPALSAAPQQVRVSYRSASDDRQRLPVTVQRTVYELVPGKQPGHFDARPLHGPLRADALYVDQVVLHSHADAPLRYGLLQVPLPAGATIEPQRYGFAIDDLSIIDRNRFEYAPLDVDGKPVASSMAVLGNERAQMFDDYYADPVPNLPAHGTVTVRHLLRVQQAGRFHLPPARYYRMYQPDAKALGAAAGHDWVVQ